MMKYEFENLVGHEVSVGCYKKIEAVYVCDLFDEMFPTKEAIATFYKNHDMNGIEGLYYAVTMFERVKKQRNELRNEVKALNHENLELRKDNVEMHDTLLQIAKLV